MVTAAAPSRPGAPTTQRRRSRSATKARRRRIALFSIVTALALAGGAAPYAAAMRVLASPAGLIALMGWTFAFLFHLLNGIRHLFWDAGMGFERTERHLSGWVAVLGALGLTACVWGLLWSGTHP